MFYLTADVRYIFDPLENEKVHLKGFFLLDKINVKILSCFISCHVIRSSSVNYLSLFYNKNLCFGIF